MQQTEAFPGLQTALISGLAAIFIYLLSIGDFIELRSSFVWLTTLLLIYLAIEISRVRRLHPTRWLINPAVLCSLMTFILYFGITNLLYFLPADLIRITGLLPEVTPSMNKLMFLVMIGALAMWLGYWSPIAARVTFWGSLVRFRSRYFKFGREPKSWVLPVLVLISLISRLTQVRLGVFGYSSSYERLLEAASYTQYLYLGSLLGTLSLVVAAFQYYSPNRSRGAIIWFFGIFIIELIFGFLLGFKTAVVMPFIIVLLCQYMRTGRLSRYFLIAIPLSLVIAFAVIEPFRYAKTEEEKLGVEFNSTSLTNIAKTLSGTTPAALYAASKTATKEQASLLVSIMARANLTYTGAVGIQYADDNENLPEGSPEFLDTIIYAPFYAWIPRFLWESKPVWDIGVWYTRTVMGYGHNGATAMGLFTYLYFAGGVIVVFGSLFFIGFMQRVIFFFTHPWKSDAGAIVFMGMLSSTVMIAEGAFNGVMVSFFRDFPLILILTAFCYARIRIILR